MWAKQDNPYEYKIIMNKRVFNDIESCNGSHNAMATLANKLLRGKYVCVCTKLKIWYEFDGTLWKQDKGGVKVRRELSTFVREQFILTAGKIRSQLTIDDLQSNMSKTSTTNTIQTKYDMIMNHAMKLQDRHYKDNVLYEMGEEMYDPYFISKLDSNQNLIAFTNGVWDLKEGRFRNASSDDLLSLNVGLLAVD